MNHFDQAIIEILNQSFRLSKVLEFSDDIDYSALETLIDSLIEMEPLKKQLKITQPEFENMYTILDAVLLGHEDYADDYEALIPYALGIEIQQLPAYLLAQCQEYSSVLFAEEAIVRIAESAYHLSDEDRKKVLDIFSEAFTQTDLLGMEKVEHIFSETVDLMRESPSDL